MGDKYSKYKEEKEKLERLNLKPGEYERRILEIALRLGI